MAANSDSGGSVNESDMVWREIANLKRRLAELEAMEHKGLAVHADEADDADTVDSLHAAASGADAHVLATDASGATQLDGILTLLSSLVLSGANSGVRMLHIPRKQTTAGSATPVFSITTTNETGDNDAGSYGCIVITEAAHSATTSSTNVASMLNMAAFTRSQRDTGAGTTSYEFQVFQTASAATDAAVRDVTGIALTATESSEYVVNVELNVGLNGSATVNPFVNCFVILIWQTYATPPTITAL
jgi:hypothetical protein